MTLWTLSVFIEKEHLVWYDNTMKKAEKLKVRHNIKDSVFTDLFRDKKYTLQLYKALHPEDKRGTLNNGILS